METLLYAGFRAVRSLFTYGMFKVFIASLIVTILALIGFIFFSSMFFAWLAHALQGHAFAYLLPWLGSLGATAIAWFLFPGIMPLIINFFDDTIARIIEEHDYPQTMQTPEQPFWPKLWQDTRFALLAIGLNILVLPLYLVPLLNLVLFYLLNGYLLGREFFRMVARRHISLRETEALYHANSGVIIIAGALLTLMATIPVVNLFAPFWGIAAMVHLYHRLEQPATTAVTLEYDPKNTLL